MPKKLLIIDDDSSDRAIISRHLKEAGFKFEILQAVTGEEGVDMIEAKQPDIVLLDTNLPKMDGFETCRKIKDLNNTNTTVVVMTGVIDAVDALRAQKMGADDYVVKTADCSSITSLLKELIKGTEPFNREK